LNIQIHKFGGASVSTADLVRNCRDIVTNQIPAKSVIVVSAMGKTTNALEKVAEAIYSKGDYQSHIDTIVTEHTAIVESLFDNPTIVLDRINDTVAEIDWIADEENSVYDYVYDQIVSIGELLSTLVVEAYLSQTLNTTYLDVRDCILTDQTYRDAIIDWDKTATRIQASVNPLFQKVDYIITQGFIGVDDENNTTTLGREGSDYTAAIFGKCLSAENVTVWKDVPGIMSADPKRFDFAEMLPTMSYQALYQMADAGAKVIHPKTMLPLKSADIPLYVRSFNDPNSPGTVITPKVEELKVPSVICKDDQILITLTPSQFNVEWSVATVTDLFKADNWDINYFQKNALSYVICVRYDFALTHLLDNLSKQFDITTKRDVRLITILNSNDAIEQQLVGNDSVLLLQRSPQTFKAVITNS
jgi:aspartate kinase